MSSRDAGPTAGQPPELVPAELPDDILVERAKNKDIAAFEALIARHEEKVYRLAMRFVHTPADAQEVLQETFLSAWRNLDNFKGDAQFGSWLYRVAANAALMTLRSQRRRPSVSIEDLPVGSADREAAEGRSLTGDDAWLAFQTRSNWSRRPDEQLQSAELRQYIQSAVDGLPEEQRQVFLLRDVDGLSTEDAAAVLSVTVPTVKNRLHRARLTLRTEIDRYFDR